MDSADTEPLPLTDRITIALDQVRIARNCQHPTHCDCMSREYAWECMLDRLIDRYIEGHR